MISDAAEKAGQFELTKIFVENERIFRRNGAGVATHFKRGSGDYGIEG